MKRYYVCPVITYDAGAGMIRQVCHIHRKMELGTLARMKHVCKIPVGENGLALFPWALVYVEADNLDIAGLASDPDIHLVADADTLENAAPISETSRGAINSAHGLDIAQASTSRAVFNKCFLKLDPNGKNLNQAIGRGV